MTSNPDKKNKDSEEFMHLACTIVVVVVRGLNTTCQLFGFAMDPSVGKCFFGQPNSAIRLVMLC